MSVRFRVERLVEQPTTGSSFEYFVFFAGAAAILRRHARLQMDRTQLQRVAKDMSEDVEHSRRPNRFWRQCAAACAPFFFHPDVVFRRIGGRNTILE